MLLRRSEKGQASGAMTMARTCHGASRAGASATTSSRCLCVGSAVLGLVAAGLILFTLLWHGATGLSLAVFTQTTPPPGSIGGLLNAIVGTLIQTGFGTLIGTPIGLMVGTYLAEYGRNRRWPTWCASSPTCCCRRRRS